MRTKNIFKLLSIFVMVVAMVSCVDDGDYTIPNANDVKDPGLTATNTLQSIKSAYSGSLVDFSKINNGKEMIFEGYVVSSDESGNFYKTISIQDKAENPTAAIRISVDATDTYTFYEVGRKVYVKLVGLGMTENNGVLEIGKLQGTSVERIPSTDYKKHIIRSTEVATIVPRKVSSISQITDSHINMLIELDNMQSENKGQTYANLNNTFSVNRTFKSCADNATIIMRNSGFADFRGQSIPEKKGKLVAVLSKYRSDFQLFIRDTKDVDFTANRCDPLFEETFTTNNFDQWTIKDVKGAQAWHIVTFGNPAPSAKISGFSSGAKENEDWLISKAIDLSKVSGATLTFDNVKRFNGTDIEVFYSKNYNGGDPNDAANTWTKLNPTLDTNTGSWTSWTASGDLDVSAAAGGNLFIAFKYVSSTSSAATFEIDNVKVLAK